MNKLKYLVIGSFIAPTLAISGGAERTALPTAFMFEPGGYVAFTISNRNYDVTDNFFAPTSSMYGDVSGAAISVKFDVNDTIAVGVAQPPSNSSIAKYLMRTSSCNLPRLLHHELTKVRIFPKLFHISVSLFYRYNTNHLKPLQLHSLIIKVVLIT